MSDKTPEPAQAANTNYLQQTSLKNDPPPQGYKWFMLILGALTNAVVVAIPTMGLSVLLPEISKDLGLSLVEAGFLWGITSLPLLFISLIAGALGDRMEPKWVVVAGCILTGLVGGLRAVAPTYAWLAVLVFLFGLFSPLITLTNIKLATIWFDSHELSLANGVLSMGMALGFMIGSIISGTFLSPWLGGWRNVFLFYGLLAAGFMLVWLFTRTAPASKNEHSTPRPSLFQGWMQLFKLRDVWLLGVSMLLVSGSIQGLLGYLPLYLNGIGWENSAAANTVAGFHLASLIGVLPIALFSNRVRSRKNMFIAVILVFMIGLALVGMVSEGAISFAVLLSGSVRDGFMAIFLTLITEIHGVDRRYSGTATGFLMLFLGIGNLILPPVGNGFASLAANAPFWFWTILTAAGCLCASFIVAEKKHTKPAAAL